MKGLMFTEQQAKHLAEISKNIVEAITELAPTNIVAISDILKFIKDKAKDFSIGLDWLIEDKEISMKSNPNEKIDYDLLKEIQKATQEGLLIDASVQIMRLKDEFVYQQVSADFKELNSFIHKAESLIKKFPATIMKHFEEQGQCINKEGLVLLKNIQNFNEEDFVKKIDAAIVLKEVMEEVNRTGQFPELQEENLNQMSPN